MSHTVNMSLLRARLAKSVGLVAACAAFSGAGAGADVVLDWNNVLLDTIRGYGDPGQSTGNIQAARAAAMMHTAVHDAVSGIDALNKPLWYSPYHVATSPGNANASREAAVAGAAHSVLTTMYPGFQVNFDAALNNTLAGLGGGQNVNDGLAWGQFVGNEILNARASDGTNSPQQYTPGTGPGNWVMPGADWGTSHWAHSNPWAMSSADQFLAPGPRALDSAEYAAAWQEVYDYGSVNSAVRTADQTEAVAYWQNGAGTHRPPGIWNVIAQSAINLSGTPGGVVGDSLSENARLFAHLNIALMDAGISSWNSKHEFNFWRPITAIHEADTDGNGATASDAAWVPLVDAVGSPEYTSGLSTFSMAAAMILTEYFGENYNFSSMSDGTSSNPDILRSFGSFAEAAFEAGDSRIWAGIHFRFSNEDGFDVGEGIADLVFNNYLLAIPTPGAGLAFVIGLAATGARRRR